MDYQFPAGKIPGFGFLIDKAGSTCTITCSGTADLRDASAVLQPELLRLHRAALESDTKLVRLDMRPMDFMNSSSIKAFMAWFMAVNEAKPKGYRIELTYDPHRRWQAVSFSAMARLASAILLLKTG